MLFGHHINFIFLTTTTRFIVIQLIVTFLRTAHRLILIQFRLSGMSPFHASVLEPHFHLEFIKCFNFLLLLQNKCIQLTCASVRPKRAASFRRSGFVMYFWIWNWISSPLRCSWLKTARDHERFRFEFPLFVCNVWFSAIDMCCRCRPLGFVCGLPLL